MKRKEVKPKAVLKEPVAEFARAVKKIAMAPKHEPAAMAYWADPMNKTGMTIASNTTSTTSIPYTMLVNH